VLAAALVVAVNLAADGCASCHAAEQGQWEHSRHAAAFSNPNFAASYARAPSPWCLTCHLENGVGCTSCHEAPHTGVPEAERCAGCHQLRLPVLGTAHRKRPTFTALPLQNTVAEWRAWRAETATAPENCSSCHFARGGHRFPGAHDAEWIEATVHAGACVERDAVRVQLHADGLGHALPTGDPFRRIVARVCLDARCAVEAGETWFARTLDSERPRVAEDTALRPGELAVADIPLAQPLPEGAWLEVRYRFADGRLERELPPDEISTLLASLPLHSCEEP
jgi:hypothetical protein